MRKLATSILLFCFLLFVGVALQSCSYIGQFIKELLFPSVTEISEIKQNYYQHAHQLRQLYVLYKKKKPADYIEFKYGDRLTIRVSDSTRIKFEKYNCSTNSSELDEVLQYLDWKRQDLETIKNLLESSHCIYLNIHPKPVDRENEFYPIEVGYKQGMNTTVCYKIFDSQLKKPDIEWFNKYLQQKGQGGILDKYTIWYYK